MDTFEDFKSEKEDLKQAVLYTRPFRPLYVKMKIFYGCNLKCEMCNHWRETREPPISSERFQALLDELAKLGTKKFISQGANQCCDPKCQIWSNRAPR